MQLLQRKDEQHLLQVDQRLQSQSKHNQYFQQQLELNKQLHYQKNRDYQNQCQMNIQQQEFANLIENPYEMSRVQKESNFCQVIAFNSDQTIMISGGKDIIVFEFNQGQLNQKQLLKDHNKVITSLYLYFMKKSNEFISGTNHDIGIWSYNVSYYCSQMLRQAHSDVVNRVIMNKNEDQIISCSLDGTIKFWIKRNQWELLQTQTNNRNRISEICLNESCTQLVSCYDSEIIISQYDQKWKKIQRIQSIYGYRICFINDNLIAFQPYNGTEMETYQLNQQNRQFIKYKDVLVEADDFCFPFFQMQYNNKKQLLLNKNGSRVNLIRYKDNSFIIEQSIKFPTEQIYGAMTDDFEYLVIWDNSNEEYQIWKQK